MAKEQTLEQTFERLEDLIGKLEQEDISLEESFKLYKEGCRCGTASGRVIFCAGGSGGKAAAIRRGALRRRCRRSSSRCRDVVR